MSVSPVSANAVYQPNAQQATFRQDFSALTSALKSGDMAGAQQAYQTLLQDNPQLASDGQNGNSNNPFQQALTTIGAALQKGDLSSAQNALQTMQQNMKAHHHHHHHHQDKDASASGTASTVSPEGILASPQTSASGINLKV